ncbi:MAG: peptide deformylase [Bacteroidales bacterium]|jgi:peptide deformylase|nr:peptide deformylase [Bacteroidales bacterium]
MVLPIYVYGAEVLREKAKEVDTDVPGVKEEISKLVSDMWETMHKADGVGLAAPQVGKSIRVLIVDGTMLSKDMPELDGFKRVMINPVIKEESEELIEFNEGCLSIPDVNAVVERPRKIKVSFTDENFVLKEESFDDFACRMVQHEMDHLEGILFTDKAAPIRKKMLQSKLNSIKSGKARPTYKIAK